MYILSAAAFVLQRQSGVVSTETMAHEARFLSGPIQAPGLKDEVQAA